jgi:hypothetical protein
MTPAQQRIATAAKIEAERNRRAIAESRLACLPSVATRLASVLIEGHEFEIRAAS